MHADGGACLDQNLKIDFLLSFIRVYYKVNHSGTQWWINPIKFWIKTYKRNLAYEELLVNYRHVHCTHLQKAPKSELLFTDRLHDYQMANAWTIVLDVNDSWESSELIQRKIHNNYNGCLLLITEKSYLYWLY